MKEEKEEEVEEVVVNNVAVLLTGALRTIEQTAPHLVAQVLEPVERAGGLAHVYACLENDTSLEDAAWGRWLDGALGASGDGGRRRLRALRWCSKAGDPLWQQLSAHLDAGLAESGVDPGSRAYLMAGGSMFEYHQLRLAHERLFREGARYDWLLRMRTDAVLLRPLRFDWLTWPAERVAARLAALRGEAADPPSAGEDETLASRFLATLLLEDEALPSVLPRLRHLSLLAADGARLPTSAAALRRYLGEGRYVLTLRANLAYLVRQRDFGLVPALGGFYGALRLPPGRAGDPWWWNAEQQFQAACRASGLDVHDYSTLHEESSLYAYERSRFFDDASGALRRDGPAGLWCVVRH